MKYLPQEHSEPTNQQDIEPRSWPRSWSWVPFLLFILTRYIKHQKCGLDDVFALDPSGDLTASEKVQFMLKYVCHIMDTS